MSGIINSAGSRSGVIGTTELEYEEGDITNPLIVGGTPFTSYGSFSVAEAIYKRIGNMVFCSYLLHTGSVDVGTGTFTLAIPFTASAQNYALSIIAVYEGGGSGWIKNSVGRIYNGSTAVDLYKDQTQATVFAGGGGSTRKIYGSLTYYI